ncbi:type II toxin-antitoxin system RelE/ParE family toxin [Oceanicoccus sagamiensis]|uniref:Addiction module toxin RelE n=1 Tax=Oceanicoccus sagamiensis TaxID=716816 RepID=A0A1X9NAQ3_9GAMM|nr:type II toxin-antitoxin system RelE/ParE family toxin [Oceanicoccus sagamiensis]ARN74696.1 hypothetical protein BST96_11535 [Oceanicoccus sagamiensis]
MRIFKTRHFAKWADKHALDDALLITAVYEIAMGMVDTSYGSYLYKKRIATRGRGKSVSVRTLLALRVNDRAFFLYGFEKNERDNISSKEKLAYKILSKSIVAFTEQEIEQRLLEGSLLEVEYE